MLAQAKGQCLQVIRKQVKLHNNSRNTTAIERSTWEALSGRTISRLCLKTETGPWRS